MNLLLVEDTHSEIRHRRPLNLRRLHRSFSLHCLRRFVVFLIIASILFGFLLIYFTNSQYIIQLDVNIKKKSRRRIDDLVRNGSKCNSAVCVSVCVCACLCMCLCVSVSFWMVWHAQPSHQIPSNACYRIVKNYFLELSSTA